MNKSINLYNVYENLLRNKQNPSGLLNDEDGMTIQISGVFHLVSITYRRNRFLKTCGRLVKWDLQPF